MAFAEVSIIGQVLHCKALGDREVAQYISTGNDEHWRRAMAYREIAESLRKEAELPPADASRAPSR